MNSKERLVECFKDLLIEYNEKDVNKLPLPKPTSKRNFEGFITTDCGNDMTDFIPENKYHDYSINKYRPYGIAGNEDGWNYSDAYIAEITPKEYIDLCYTYIFHKPTPTMEELLDRPEIIKSNVDKYAEQMKQGTKFNLPYIDFRKEQQEGRHRALAAYKNNYNTMPCLILK